MTMPSLDPLSAEHLLARSGTELAHPFDRVLNAETVDRYVHESYQTLYRTGAIKTYLPTLAARFAADRLIALGQASGQGCGDARPIYPGKRYLDWSLDDPDTEPVDVVRGIRDEIDRRVHQLLDELGSVA